MTHDHVISVSGPVTWGQDTVSIFPHGYAYSHLDALSHAAFDEAFYNGYGVETLTESGSVVLGVDVMRDGIASRGVLIDLPGLEEVEYLEPRTLVTVADLEAWERSTGERVGEGDVLLVRTGRWAREAAQGRWTLYCPGARLGSETPIEEVLQQCREADEGAAGLHPSVARWLRQSRGRATWRSIAPPQPGCGGHGGWPRARGARPPRSWRASPQGRWRTDRLPSAARRCRAT